MSDIQRWTCYYTNSMGHDYPAFSSEEDGGDWVLSEDCTKLESELAALREQKRVMLEALEVVHQKPWIRGRNSHELDAMNDLVHRTMAQAKEDGA